MNVNLGDEYAPRFRKPERVIHGTALNGAWVSSWIVQCAFPECQEDIDMTYDDHEVRWNKNGDRVPICLNAFGQGMAHESCAIELLAS